ncbi:heme exporter protein CcmB [Deinococcus cellulosilyticus]|uniref:Heme exporter protein B n=1 Tax=Deinococcus cellulosilyticus (strain DSM 18568 / NBRC 106333 / KACC 11606 / 5516J-15) TaxID=1223518 RepID=A0A511N7L8_DEIC1|nr:heme exporter protein CcmB [Deinococcus cellulosilyticus]GEM48842.1 cytochrome c-type biogenesis heme exporter protein B [Deinococcus cellulosilyticus NBRC 106333 = KACC 11606]
MREALLIALKDLRLEGRSKDILTTTVFFSALVVLIMGFALGPDTERLKDAAPGVLWTALAFASVLAAQRAFGSEQESGALESLLLYPNGHEWVFVGKLIANYLLMLLLGAVTLVTTSLIYNLSYTHLGYLVLVLLLGVLGFSIISVFYAAITVNLRAKEALLPVLMFPICIPVVIGAVSATKILAQNGLTSDLYGWLQLLAGFDLVSLLVAALAFPHALEN